MINASLRLKLLLLCILLVMFTTAGISTMYYVLMKREAQRESRQRIRIAFDLTLDDLERQRNVIKKRVVDFFQRETRLGSLMYLYAREVSPENPRRPVGVHLVKAAEELTRFGWMIEPDRILVYGADRELLLLYDKEGRQSHVGGYVFSATGKAYLPMDDPELQDKILDVTNNNANDTRHLAIASKVPFPENPLPEGIPARAEQEIPPTMQTGVFQAGGKFGYRLVIPISSLNRMVGMLIADVFYTQEMIAHYAKLSKADLNMFAGTQFSIGTLPAQAALSSQTRLSCDDLLKEGNQFEMLSLKIGAQVYYQGQCAFTAQHEVVGAMTVSLSQQIEQQAISRMLTAILTNSLIVFGLLSIAVSIAVQVLFARPIEQLMQVMKEMETGNFDAEARIASHDEFEKLARAFNAMGARLKESFSKREQLMRTLAEERNLLRILIDNMPDFIYVKNAQSQYLAMNQASMTSFRIRTLAEMVGKTDADFLPADLAEKFLNDERAIMRNGEGLINLEEAARNNLTGEPMWLLTTKIPFRNSQGEVAGLVGISRNITELKLTQQRLQRLNEELEQRVKERTTALERANQEILALNAQLTDENLRMSAEMELARRIQTSLLPPLAREVHPDFEISAVMLPAEEVGGDYYDIVYAKNGDLWLAIGDVSGHGVTPGLIMMMAQTVHSTITTQMDVSPKGVVIATNEMLYQNVHERLRAEQHMTFTTLKYLGGGVFRHAGAHLDLLVHRCAANACELIDTPGVYLNFVEDISEMTVESSFTLAIGDTLILYTDGLTEARNAADKIFDVTRFKESIERHAALSPAALRDAIMQDVLAWSGGIREDDMTLVVVRRVK